MKSIALGKNGIRSLLMFASEKSIEDVRQSLTEAFKQYDEILCK